MGRMKIVLVVRVGSVLEIKNGKMLAFGEPGEIYGPSLYDKMFLSKYATAAPNTRCFSWDSSSKHPVLFFRQSVHFGRGGYAPFIGLATACITGYSAEARSDNFKNTHIHVVLVLSASQRDVLGVKNIPVTF